MLFYVIELIAIIPIRANKIIIPVDDLFSVFCDSLRSAGETLRDGDIVVIAETVVATVQYRIIDLHTVKASPKAIEIASNYDMIPELVELIIQNADEILGGVKGVLLTIAHNIILANAGIDLSNSGGNENAVLLPDQPYLFAENFRKRMISEFGLANAGVIISDSHIQPLKKGVIGSAIAVSGFHPVDYCIGRTDLFGHRMRYTNRAVADQIVCGAHLVMGECDERIPFVVVRNAPVKYTDDKIDEKEMLMEKSECLFMNVFYKGDT